ncbi:transposase [Undibacterium cyanobacteriorum]|uniref:Transposase n=1 Tax=Undibacterium cyanobacteriorum TaxID=3073561 RepID=A0ABY9RLT2_9BURK|nr:transposase [Undibacterium sp. 20NA77.5]WMW81916.1 transposase [Undibacterium sp. 20NA77.5]
MKYRRVKQKGGTYFFTLVLADRSSRLLLTNIEYLREAIRKAKEKHPFDILAIVILPDHLHTIWQLPEGDSDYAMRWSLIKASFTRSIPRGETISQSRSKKRERGIWQRRYWEHLIVDEIDLENHMNYIHFNPVKHGHVLRASDWPFSSIHREISRGNILPDWSYLASDEGLQINE